MMMLDSFSLDQLRVFVTIADLGSFTAAARHLRRAQSAISHAVANLEKSLGLALFDRNDWRPRLTADGQALLADARSVLARAEQMKLRAKGLNQGLEAELSIIFDVFFPVARMVKLVSDFQQAFPNVVLRLRTEALGGVPDRVVNKDYCLGVQGSLPDIDPTLVSYSMPEIGLEPVAAPTHPLSLLSKISRDLLREHPQVILTDPSKRTEGRMFSVYAEQRILTSDFGSKHGMLRSGLGWGFMPLSIVKDDIDCGRLTVLDLADRPPRTRRMPLYLIHRSEESPGIAAQCVIRELTDAERASY